MDCYPNHEEPNSNGKERDFRVWGLGFRDFMDCYPNNGESNGKESGN